MTYAPIALFIFKRPDHTRRTIQALMACPEFYASEVFVFCDGPRNSLESVQVQASRRVARELLGKKAHFVESSRNRGLAESIICGVTRLCESHGRVIVLEDDLEVAPSFLAFINESLDRYKNDDSVMQVSGYMFPIKWPQNCNEAMFLPFTSSWGWGTWLRAWTKFDASASGWEQMKCDYALRNRFNIGKRNYYGMLKQQMDGKIDSWAIRWYWSVFKENGLVLFPSVTLVINIGFDGSGTHGWRSAALHQIESAIGDGIQTLPERIAIQRENLLQVSEHLSETRPAGGGIIGIFLFVARIIKKILGQK